MTGGSNLDATGTLRKSDDLRALTLLDCNPRSLKAFEKCVERASQNNRSHIIGKLDAHAIAVLPNICDIGNPKAPRGIRHSPSPSAAGSVTASLCDIGMTCLPLAIVNDSRWLPERQL